MSRSATATPAAPTTGGDQHALAAAAATVEYSACPHTVVLAEAAPLAPPRPCIDALCGAYFDVLRATTVPTEDSDTDALGGGGGELRLLDALAALGTLQTGTEAARDALVDLSREEAARRYRTGNTNGEKDDGFVVMGKSAADLAYRRATVALTNGTAMVIDLAARVAPALSPPLVLPAPTPFVVESACSSTPPPEGENALVRLQALATEARGWRQPLCAYLSSFANTEAIAETYTRLFGTWEAAPTATAEKSGYVRRTVVKPVTMYGSFQPALETLSVWVARYVRVVVDRPLPSITLREHDTPEGAELGMASPVPNGSGNGCVSAGLPSGAGDLASSAIARRMDLPYAVPLPTMLDVDAREWRAVLGPTGAADALLLAGIAPSKPPHTPPDGSPQRHAAGGTATPRPLLGSPLKDSATSKSHSTESSPIAAADSPEALLRRAFRLKLRPAETDVVLQDLAMGGGGSDSLLEGQCFDDRLLHRWLVSHPSSSDNSSGSFPSAISGVGGGGGAVSLLEHNKVLFAELLIVALRRGDAEVIGLMWSALCSLPPSEPVCHVIHHMLPAYAATVRKRPTTLVDSDPMADDELACSDSAAADGGAGQLRLTVVLRTDDRGTVSLRTDVPVGPPSHFPEVISSEMFGALVSGAVRGLRSLPSERQPRHAKMLSLALLPALRKRTPLVPLDAATELSTYCLEHTSNKDCQTMYQGLRASFHLDDSAANCSN